MAQIFISYAREDFQQARTLYQQLKAEGFSPWMDKVDLIGGQQWQPAIEKAIRQAEFFRLLLSRNSVKKRGFVQREIRAALDLWKDKLEDDVYLIPVMLEAMAGEEVPTEVSKFQWIDLYESEGWEQLQRALEFGLAQRGLAKKPVTASKSDFRVMLGDVPLEMIYVPSGTFMMGSPGNEIDREKDRLDYESPQRRVSVPDFWMGKYQVTQAQWQAVMGSNPSHFKGNDHPVEQVSWEDAQAFCQRLSQTTGKNFRLPSEAEWEYACRAGTTTPFAFGTSLASTQANFDGNHPYGGAANGPYLKSTTPVGSYAANAFGLYDMHGNVWEWCEDVWHGNYDGAPDDGFSWLSGGDSRFRVARGGSWVGYGSPCHSADRYGHAPGDCPDTVGFRVVSVSKAP